MASRSPPKRPTRRRLCMQALRVLEQAAADAKEAPIAVTPAIRLALGWLIYDGLAEVWQAETFVTGLTTMEDPDRLGVGPAKVIRSNNILLPLAAWQSNVKARDMVASGMLGG